MKYSKKMTTQTLLAAALAGTTFMELHLPVAQAAIIPTGNVTPTYPGTNPDPWNIIGGLRVGNSGTGELKVTAGSDVTASSASYLGFNPGSDGTLTLEDSGTIADFANLFYVGFSGDGLLDVKSGAFFESGNFFVGRQTTGNGTVNLDGSGSEINLLNSAYIGRDNLGALNITNGGFFDVTDLLIVGLGATGDGTVNLSGINSEVEAGSLFVGSSGEADFFHTGGLLEIAGDTFIAANAGSLGNLDINGPNATAQFFGDVFVGGTSSTNGGSGDFDVFNGQVIIGDFNRFTISSSTDGLFISDDDSVGGLLVYKNGATGTINEFTYLGFASDESGEMRLTDSLTSVTMNNQPFIGYQGDGTVTVENGAELVMSAGASIGRFSGATGTVNVDGNNSLFNVSSGSLGVGVTGTGVINISNGGLVKGLAVLGDFTSGDGTVNVDGAGSEFDSTGLVVGSAGEGTLNVTNGGLVDNLGSLRFADQAGSTGNLTISGSGSIIETSDDLYVGGTFSTPGGVGDLDILDGKVLVGGVTDAQAVFGDGLYFSSINFLSGTSGNGIIRNGSTVDVTGALALGMTAASGGQLRIMDAGTVVTVSGSAILGLEGEGYVIVGNGAVLNTGTVDIGSGFNSFGQATINSGGTWNAGAFRLGFSGLGEADVFGTLNVSSLTIGANSLSPGANRVDVSGTGASINGTGNAAIGSSSKGDLTIQSGGQVVFTGNTFMGVNSLGDGSITLTGTNSVYRTQGDMFVGTFDGLTDTGVGRIDVTDGSFYVGDLAPSATSNTPGFYISDSDSSGGNVVLRNVSSLQTNVPVALGWDVGHSGTLTVHDSIVDVSAVTDTFIGRAGDGTVTLETDAIFSSAGSVSIAALAGSNGVLNVNNLGALFQTSGDLSVGGTAIADGGAASINHIDGRIIVGDGNPFTVSLGSGFYIADSGPLTSAGGRVIVRNGATVNVPLMDIAALTSHTGQLTLTGSGTTLTSDGGIFVGNAGTGEMIVEEGALATGSSVSVGNQAMGEGHLTISGANSRVTGNGGISIGLFGEGHVTVDQGGELSSNTDGIFLGFMAGSKGTLTVDGSGSQVNVPAALSVGRAGEGDLSVVNGADVTAGTVELGRDVDNVGDGSSITVDGSGSTITATLLRHESQSDAALTVTNSGALDLDFLQLGVGSGISPTADFTISNGGTVDVTGVGSFVELGTDTSASVDFKLLGGANPGIFTTNNLFLGSRNTTDFDGGDASILVEFGAKADIEGVFRVGDGGIINLLGGEIEADDFQISPNATTNWFFGTLHDTSDFSIDFSFAQGLFGNFTPTLTMNQTLLVDDQLTLFVPFTLDGGTLAFDSLVNGSLFNWQSGTVISGQSVTSSGAYGDYLRLNSSMSLQNDVVDTSLVAADGELQLNGGYIRGAAFEVDGYLHGDGRIETDVAINSTGQLYVNAGESLFVESIDNSGIVHVINGDLTVNQLVNNRTGSPPASVIGEGATLRFLNGMTNDGTLAFSGANSRVIGDINNSATGQIIVSGHTEVTMTEDVSNFGSILVSSSASAVFFGSFSGNGITGGGQVFLEGDTRPGFSPGIQSYDLSLLTFGPNHMLFIELGGLLPGEFDRVENTGVVSLNGDLIVTLINGFTPSFGDTFEFVSGSSLTGPGFNYTPLALPGGLLLDLVAPGTLQVIPEPTTGLIGLVVGVSLLRRRRAN